MSVVEWENFCAQFNRKEKEYSQVNKASRPIPYTLIHKQKPLIFRDSISARPRSLSPGTMFTRNEVSSEIREEMVIINRIKEITYKLNSQNYNKLLLMDQIRSTYKNYSEQIKISDEIKQYISIQKSELYKLTNEIDRQIAISSEKLRKYTEGNSFLQTQIETIQKEKDIIEAKLKEATKNNIKLSSKLEKEKEKFSLSKNEEFKIWGEKYSNEIRKRNSFQSELNETKDGKSFAEIIKILENQKLSLINDISKIRNFAISEDAEVEQISKEADEIESGNKKIIKKLKKYRSAIKCPEIEELNDEEFILEQLEKRKSLS